MQNQLSQIKGIGVKRAAKLQEAGINSLEDLLLSFPNRYINLGVQADFENLKQGDAVEFLAEVAASPFRRRIRKGLYMLSCRFKTDDGKFISCMWMNQPYVARQLVVGQRLYISGKAKFYNNRLSVVSPVLYKPKAGENNEIIPVYKMGIPTNIFCEAVKAALEAVKINSFIPNEIAQKFNLLPLDSAIKAIHFPTSIYELESAQKSIAAERLSHELTCFKLLKNASNTALREPLKADTALAKAFSQKLNFALTREQDDAIERIISSMQSGKPLNILLQGDVGCGKTIVAFSAMYYAAINGMQSVLMAPTEILARQHFNRLNELLPLNIKSELLTASLTKAQRNAALFNLKHSNAQIAVGTHSLLSSDVEFENLRLVITDEQHRFGVNQRGILQNKGENIDTIVISATPIPRTLALTLYGELELVTIKQQPQTRAGVLTKIVPQQKVKDMMEYVYQKAQNGEQTFIVCPRIEQTDEEGLLSATEFYDKVSKSKFAKFSSLLHGQMKDEQKLTVMSGFEKGDIKVLVCTSLIEVGIDVANATTMIIFNAERYGLSQLHQMRGRVGRADKSGYCFILYNQDNMDAKQRLEFFSKCGDGFELAEYDFENRGGGDFIGTRQHGDNDSFLGLKITAPIIKTAQDLSDYLLNDKEIANNLMQSLAKKNTDFIKNITLN